jgi:CheY-like chemotaxis protein
MIKFRIFGLNKEAKELAVNPPVVASAELPSTVDAAPANPNGKRVVIVDDNTVFLKATATKLQLAGFQVATAKESSQAIAALGERPTDAVLMDINFPPDVCNGGMGSWDGFQLMAWLRCLPVGKGVRFIVVSGSDSAADRKRAQELGAVAYLQKPLDHERLFEAMDAAN